VGGGYDVRVCVYVCARASVCVCVRARMNACVCVCAYVGGLLEELPNEQSSTTRCMPSPGIRREDRCRRKWVTRKSSSQICKTAISTETYRSLNRLQYWPTRSYSKDSYRRRARPHIRLCEWELYHRYLTS
jgi:hypothetical protein